MDCDRCDEPAVMHAAYSGQHLCDTHFCQTVEKRVRRRIREDNLVPDDATPAEPATWIVGLSGGKDSVVLTQILHETFDQDPRIELVALSIHEGIEGYRDESLAACEQLTDSLGMRHETVSYAEELGVRMDDVVTDDPENMAACAYCGVFRRDLLETHAENLDANLMLTGHNLDDEAETALMNVLEGDTQQMARHFDASIGPLDDGDWDSGEAADEGDDPLPTERTRHRQDHHVPRAKPLRDVPEKEVALYAQLRELPMHHAECPHADESFRGEIQDLLLKLEENHPGTRHSIMAGYEELASMAAGVYGDDDVEVDNCEECGAPTARGVCRKCDLLAALGAT